MALGASNAPKTIRCAACGFVYYFNPAIAVGGLILNGQGELLLIRRAKEPARGKLAVPGGFVDIGETAEVALRREVREEVGLELGPLVFLCSHVNHYEYQGITYPVLDLFFVSPAKSAAGVAAPDEVESISWQHPAAVDPEAIAFPSIRAAIAEYVRGGKSPAAR